MLDLDVSEVCKRAIKYLIEGMAVAVAAFYIPKRKMNVQEIVMIAVTAAASLAVLDLLAPSVGGYARHGAGFGIGSALVGAPGLPGVPPL
jgi:ABC-type Co2+ transport system permease subunit